MGRGEGGGVSRSRAQVERGEEGAREQRRAWPQTSVSWPESQSPSTLVRMSVRRSASRSVKPAPHTTAHTHAATTREHGQSGRPDWAAGPASKQRGASCGGARSGVTSRPTHEPQPEGR